MVWFVVVEDMNPCGEPARCPLSLGGEGILVPNNRTDALLRALASAEPAEEPVLVLLSLAKGGVEGEMGILTAEEGDSIGIEFVRGEASRAS